ncbi:MAG TPA: tRNA pseudouridine synthase A [Vicinamibacterales bacterium]
MPTFRVLVAYDGTDFVGWQRQASGVSIQGLLEEALKPLEGRSVTVTGAGRTDAGVHALGQVAAFSLERPIDPATIVRALNARLPPDVRATFAEEVPSAFRVRFDARSKTYRYRIWNADVVPPFERRYVWHLTGALDLAAMNAAARMLEGTHDFAAFQASGGDAESTTRTVMASRVMGTGRAGRSGGSGRADGLCGTDGTKRREETNKEGESMRRESSVLSHLSDLSHLSHLSHTTYPTHLTDPTCLTDPTHLTYPTSPARAPLVLYEIIGDGFLRHMVRAIVGTLVEIGRRRRPPEWMGEVLASRTRTAAGRSAPACGLFLVSVDYGDAVAAEP